MAGFLYWVETSAQVAGLELVRQWGLGYAFVDSPACRGATLGGTLGLLLVEERLHEGKETKLDPSNQEWRRLPDLEGQPPRWFGWWKDDPPRPEELAKANTLPGYDVTDAQGGNWRLPLTRKPSEEGDSQCVLPQTYDYDQETGGIKLGLPREDHRVLWENTEWAWQAMLDGKEVGDEECLVAVGLVVRANYRADYPELLAIGCWSSEPGKTPGWWLAIAVGAIEWANWRREKGSDPTPSPEEGSGVSSSPGEAV